MLSEVRLCLACGVFGGSPENCRVSRLLQKAEHEGLLVRPQNQHRAGTTWRPSQEVLGVEGVPSLWGLRWFTTKLSGYLVEPQNQDRRLGGQRWDPSAPRSFEAGDRQHDRGACVRRTQRPDGCTAVRWRTSCVQQNAHVRAPNVGVLRSFSGGHIYRRSG
jgi:hypothetical protein